MSTKFLDDTETAAYIAECVRLRQRAASLYDKAVFTKNDLETLATAEDHKYFDDYLTEIEFGCPWDASDKFECCGHHVLSAQQHRAVQNERLRQALDKCDAATWGDDRDAILNYLRNVIKGGMK